MEKKRENEKNLFFFFNIRKIMANKKKCFRFFAEIIISSQYHTKRNINFYRF